MQAAKTGDLSITRYNSLLKSAVEQRTEAEKRTQDFRGQFTRLEGDKYKLQTFKTDVEAALARIEDTRSSLKVLIDDEKTAHVSSAALSESLKEIYNSTIPLDDHIKAKGFAAALLSVFRHALDIKLLRSHLRVDVNAEHVQRVLSDIATSV